MNIIGSFKVNQVKVFTPNSQYTVIVLADRLLFTKTGGQFADFRYLLAYSVPITILGIIFGVIGGLVNSEFEFLFLGAGMGLGGLLGNIIAKKYARPRDTKVIPIENELAAVTVEEMLSRNEKNFSLPFTEIRNYQLSNSTESLNGPRTGVMTVNGTRYDIAPGQDFNKIQSLVVGVLNSR